MSIITVHWESQHPGKPREDWHTHTPDGRVVIVADGVTRHGHDGPYPDPSPARMAAEAFTEATLNVLCEREPAAITSADLPRAAEQGNTAVRRLNGSLGFWETTDYWGKDLAGAVAAFFVLQSEKLLYGFLTDCGVAVIAPSSEVLFITEDVLARVRPHLPTIELEGSEQARFVRVRRDHRNVLPISEATYGVFTGEEHALAYVQYGEFPLSPGVVVCAFSDGLRPFLDDSAFRAAIVSGSRGAIARYVKQRSPAGNHTDEKTLVAVYT